MTFFSDRLLEVYALPQDMIRCEATTVSGAHEVTAKGLLQFGQSKEDPTRPPIKVMMGSLDPLGLPLATDVLSGERADDG
jgi:transposase